MHARECSCGWNAHNCSKYEATVYDTLTGYIKVKTNAIPQLHPLDFGQIGALNFEPSKQFLLFKESKNCLYHFREPHGYVAKLPLSQMSWDVKGTSPDQPVIRSVYNGIYQTSETPSESLGTFHSIKFMAIYTALDKVVVVYDKFNVRKNDYNDFVAVLKFNSDGSELSPVQVHYPLFYSDNQNEQSRPAKYAHVRRFLIMVRNRSIHTVVLQPRMQIYVFLRSDNRICSEVGAVLATKEGRVYLFGGKDDNGVPVNTVLSFDLRTRTLKTDHMPMKWPRANCSALVINNELCVLGGYEDAYGYTPVECYDEAKNSWRLINYIKFDTASDACVVIPQNETPT